MVVDCPGNSVNCVVVPVACVGLVVNKVNGVIGVGVGDGGNKVVCGGNVGGICVKGVGVGCVGNSVNGVAVSLVGNSVLGYGVVSVGYVPVPVGN